MPKPNNAPPAADEAEVTVLGRGSGESCLVHLGSHKWMIVDSFNVPSIKERRIAGQSRPTTVKLSAPGVYLDDLYEGSGLTPEVVTIVLTHFHRDHYLGIEQLHSKYETAKLVVTVAVKYESFQALFGPPSDGSLREVGAAMTRASRRRFGDHSAVRGIKHADVGKPIAPPLDGVQVIALAPSDLAADVSARELADLLATQPTTAAVTSALEDDNRTSIALHVTACGVTALLGGDVIEDPPELGWLAVVDNEELVELGATEIVKVPHHGGSGAHTDCMWDRFVVPGSPMLVAPFWGQRIPSRDEQAKLKSRGSVYQAATSSSTHTSEWESIPKQPARLGVVQARKIPGREWVVGVESPSHQL